MSEEPAASANNSEEDAESSSSSSDGVVRFSHVLSADTCEELMEYLVDRMVQNHLRIPPNLLYDILYRKDDGQNNCEALFETILQVEQETSTRIEQLEIYAPGIKHWDEYPGASYEDWERFGKHLGKLSSLREMHIKEYVTLDDDEEEEDPFDCICLGYLVRWAPLESLRLQVELLNRHSLEPFLDALSNVSTLQSIHFMSFTEPESIDAIVSSVLQQLPSLRTLKFSSVLEGIRRHLPDSVFHLVASRSIQNLELDTCTLTKQQCQLLADALEASISTLETLNLLNARFSESGCILMAQALETNSSLKCLKITLGGLCSQFFDHLAHAFTVSTTTSMESIMVYPYDLGDFDCDDLIPLFQSFRHNTTLRHLTLSHLHFWSNGAALALRAFLEAPLTRLETLSLSSSGAVMPEWRLLLPFLQVNQSLKCFFGSGLVDRYDVVEVVSLLEFNTSLEVLVINPCIDEDYDSSYSNDDNNEDEDLSELNDGENNSPALNEKFVMARAVRALKLNYTIRHLDIVHPSLLDDDQSDQGSKQLAQALKMNFGLGRHLNGSWLNAGDVQSGQMTQILKDDRPQPYQRDIESICLLNKAGRHYLLQDPSNRSLGVKTLSAISGNLNCLYIHLLENPSLCETSGYG